MYVHLLLFLALFGPARPLPAPWFQDGESAMVEGFVVRVGASTPIPRAEVVLRTGGDGPGIRSTTVTDGSGRFVFTAVPPGVYELSASAEGYVRGAYGEERAGGPGALLPVRSGEEIRDMNIGLVPNGVISGYIEDPFGQPVVGATVRALQFSYERRNRILSEVRTTTTNDRGEYRLYWLEAGQYFVSAQPRDNRPLVGTVAVGRSEDGRPPVQTSGVNVARRPVPVYYPGTVDPAFASVIDVGAGIDYTGINMRTVEVSAVRVRGRVVGAVADPSVRTTIRLVPRSTVVGSQSEPTARVGQDGTFELVGVIPGAYSLIALANGANGPGPSGRAERAFAHLDIDIGEDDIDNLTLSLTPGLTVRGRVYIEPAAGQELLNPAEFRVALVADRIRYGVSAGPSATLRDGSFRIDGLPPNDYRIELYGLTSGAYLKEARLGTTEVLNFGVRILNEPSPELSLLVAEDSGTVTASIVDGQGRPVAGVQTVLVPDLARRSRLDLYRMQTSERDGRVAFEDVVPGVYKLFAWEEEIPSGAWANEEFLRQYEDLGEPLRLEPLGLVDATVTTVPAR